MLQSQLQHKCINICLGNQRTQYSTKIKTILTKMITTMLVDNFSLNLIANNVGDVYHYYITMYYIHVLLRDYCARKKFRFITRFS